MKSSAQNLVETPQIHVLITKTSIIIRLHNLLFVFLFYEIICLSYLSSFNTCSCKDYSVDISVKQSDYNVLVKSCRCDKKEILIAFL